MSLFAVHKIAKLRERVEGLLPRITCPVLIMYSTLDRWIAPHSAQFTYDQIGTSDKTLIALHNSGHEVTLDSEWEEVADQTYQFICQRLSAEEIPKQINS
jgi:carboxylesterase